MNNEKKVAMYIGPTVNERGISNEDYKYIGDFEDWQDALAYCKLRGWYNDAYNRGIFTNNELLWSEGCRA